MTKETHDKPKKSKNKRYSEQRKQDEGAVELCQELAQITHLLFNLKASFLDLEMKMDKLRNEFLALQSKSQSEGVYDGKCFESVIARTSYIDSASTKEEIWEQIQRIKNGNKLIIFGLHEKNEDEYLVKMLFNDLKINFDNVRAIYRIASPPSKQLPWQKLKRPLVVVFAGKEKKDEALTKAKNIRSHSKWIGVYMRHKLTKLQRLERNKCREFLNQSNA